MGEKAPHGPLLSDGHNDNFVHPSAPPSYNDAMTGGSQSLNHPFNPYQGHSSQGMPNPVVVSQPVPYGIPAYPTLPANIPNVAVAQPLPYGAYGNQPMNIPNPQTQVQVVTVPASVTHVVAVGPKGMRMRCCNCGADIKSTTITSNKASAHIACLILCIFTCCLCFWIPYCMSSCKRIDHKCPNCKGYLGTYNA